MDIQELFNRYASGEKTLEEDVKNLATAVTTSNPIGPAVAQKYITLEKKTEPKKIPPAEKDFNDLARDLYLNKKSPIETPYLLLKKAFERKFPENIVKQEKEQFIKDVLTYSNVPKPGERQKHGFAFEAEVIKKLNLKNVEKYTNYVDAYKGSVPYQIKTVKKGGEIGLGTLKPEKFSQDTVLIVGVWEDSKDDILEVYQLVLESSYMLGLAIFKDTPTKNKLLEIFKNFKTFTKEDRQAEKKWQQFLRVFKKYEGKEEVKAIKTRFKRDHKGQLRIQGAIPFKDFLALGATKIKLDGAQ